MRKIAIIGNGRLGQNLNYDFIQKHNIDVKCFSRTGNFEKNIQNFSQLAYLQSNTDAIILAISDQFIEEVAKLITEKCEHLTATTYLLHTSGSTDISVLASWGEKIGVLYPLQIFTTEKMADLSEVPFFCEQKDGGDFVMQLAKEISKRVYQANSAERRQIHLGAVFCCNFTNYLYRISENLLPSNADISVYQPLIVEHLQKVFAFGAENTQTGPAIRGDKSTIQTHLAMLENQPQWQEIYYMMSKAINEKSVSS